MIDGRRHRSLPFPSMSVTVPHSLPEVFMALDDDTVTLYLQAMSPRTAAKILKEFKLQLLHQLERVGTGEMFIFPEPEHACNHLKRRIEMP